MVKKLLKIFSVLLIVTLIIASIFFYSIYISVGRINIDYGTLASEKIPPDMDGISIAFFSDIHYGTFMNSERLQSMIEKINHAHPDILIFLGDVFDHPEISPPNEETIQNMKAMLGSLEAPLGKFAVLGEHDEANDGIKAIVKDILYQSNFEVLENRSIRLRNGSNSSITLVGIDSLINGNVDIATAFHNVNAEEYNILITHCPDLATSSDLPLTSIDLIVAGHSHGGQIYLPFIGPISPIDGARTYYHGSYTINDTQLVITNGLGTTDMDMRLFAPPQLTFYRLYSKASKPDNDNQKEP